MCLAKQVCNSISIIPPVHFPTLETHKLQTVTMIARNTLLTVLLLVICFSCCNAATPAPPAPGGTGTGGGDATTKKPSSASINSLCVGSMVGVVALLVLRL